MERIVFSKSVGSFGNREHWNQKASATAKVRSVAGEHDLNIPSQ